MLLRPKLWLSKASFGLAVVGVSFIQMDYKKPSFSYI
jgi:hypothetical protein